MHENSGCHAESRLSPVRLAFVSSAYGVTVGRAGPCPCFFLFFNYTATTEIYTLSLHDALPISLARQFKPTAITLDIFLPDMLGWTVLNNLKLDPTTRHIPVQVISIEEERQHGLAHGAFSYTDRKSTRLNSSHSQISYAVFCLKK